MGVDALIIEGMEAGGHIGPVSTSVVTANVVCITNPWVLKLVVLDVNLAAIIPNPSVFL